MRRVESDQSSGGPWGSSTPGRRCCMNNSLPLKRLRQANHPKSRKLGMLFAASPLKNRSYSCNNAVCQRTSVALLTHIPHPLTDLPCFLGFYASIVLNARAAMRCLQRKPMGNKKFPPRGAGFPARVILRRPSGVIHPSRGRETVTSVLTRSEGNGRTGRNPVSSAGLPSPKSKRLPGSKN